MDEEQLRAYYAMHGMDMGEEYEDGEEQYEEDEDVWSGVVFASSPTSRSTSSSRVSGSPSTTCMARVQGTVAPGLRTSRSPAIRTR
jgi:hypothetical protein